MTHRRKPELSVMNVLLCSALVFINFIYYAIEALKPGTAAYTAVITPYNLSSLAIPGFVMLAGIRTFLSSREDTPYLKHLVHRILDIILPYTVCFIVYYAFYAILYRYPLDILYILKHYLSGNLVRHLYLIPLLFQFDLLLPLWKQLINKCSPIVILPLALLLSPLCTDYIPQIINTAFPGVVFEYNDRIFTSYITYWLIGCYIGRNYDGFCHITEKNLLALGIIYGILTGLNILLNILAFSSLAFVPYLGIIQNGYIIYAFVFLLAVFRKFGDTAIAKNPVVHWTDKLSLYIILYHMLIALTVERIIEIF